MKRTHGRMRIVYKAEGLGMNCEVRPLGGAFCEFQFTRKADGDYVWNAYSNKEAYAFLCGWSRRGAMDTIEEARIKKELARIEEETRVHA